MKREALRLAMPWLAMAVLLIIWEICCVVFDVPEIILPRPSKVFVVFYNRFDILMSFCWDTLWTTLMGFLLAIAGGLLFGACGRRLGLRLFRPLSAADRLQRRAKVRSCDPDDLARRRRPAAIITAFAISFFPIVVNVATGLATMEPRCVTCCAASEATRTEILTKVGIPRAMPYLFASLKVAITLAFIGSVISETVGAIAASASYAVGRRAQRRATTFAGLFAIAIMGVAMYAICALVEKRMTRWAFRANW